MPLRWPTAAGARRAETRPRQRTAALAKVISDGRAKTSSMAGRRGECLGIEEAAAEHSSFA